MSKTKIKKQTATEQKAGQLLKPLIDYVQNTRGIAVEIAEELSRRTKKKVWAGNIRMWLDPDPKTRIEMRFGMGLILIELWGELQSGKWPKQQ